MGELGLDGSLRGVPGTVVLAEALRRHRLVVPEASAREASLAGECDIRVSATLAGLVDRLSGRRPWVASGTTFGRSVRAAPGPPGRLHAADLADVRGQRLARRALEVAAAGGHHLLLVGPPGSGKTMLANRLAGLLPGLERPTALEATRIHSVAGLPLPQGGLIEEPPFRAPPTARRRWR